MANISLFGTLIIDHNLFMAVRMLLKLGHIVWLLGKNLWHSLHFLSDVINSLFSPHPLIFNGLVSLLPDSFDDIMFQFVDSLSEWGEVAFYWFRIRGEYAQEILELRGNTASNWSYDVNFNIFQKILYWQLTSSGIVYELSLNLDDRLQNICYLLLLISIVDRLYVVVL